MSDDTDNLTNKTFLGFKKELARFHKNIKVMHFALPLVYYFYLKYALSIKSPLESADYLKIIFISFASIFLLLSYILERKNKLREIENDSSLSDAEKLSSAEKNLIHFLLPKVLALMSSSAGLMSISLGFGELFSLALYLPGLIVQLFVLK